MPSGSIGLYFDLKKGENADLEVVAEAMLHWVEALRIAARLIEHEAQIRVEFVDAQESSLRINAILDWAEEQLARIDRGSRKYWRIRKLAIALVIFVPTVGYPTYEFYFGEDDTINLNEEDRKRLDELIKLTRDTPEIEAQRRKFFRTLERDPSISGAGVAEGKNDPPAILVPSAEFPERSGLWAAEEDKQERTLRPVLDVILVGPMLVSRPRPWKFQPEGLPEFTAIMKDRRFLDALEQSHVRERLRTGIRMTIRLEVKEKKVGGDWVAKRGGRSVIEVISPATD